MSFDFFLVRARLLSIINSELPATSKPLASMWERTLQDLVRGLRANKKDEAKFIARAVDEIRQEIKSDDMELKAGAVLKLTYVRTSQLSCYLI